MTKLPHYQQGFTLIELGIVSAIVVIISILAAPSFAQFIKQDRLVTNANRVHSLIKFARSEAVKRETQINLRANGDVWEVVEDQGTTDEAIINNFNKTTNTVTIVFPTVSISPTGEFGSALNISITDGDSSTNDFLLCGLISGQTWLLEGASGCG
ncbi:GspH/FimT family pseudopilin [Alteromonas sp. 5E99-2]|uniref:GspH/FimT family pseudopilin n=1 Tax=Alteromonas sp. 5E99-2 TaxID=2817683 RepID=UPI001A980313|nr:GspH/FimT family pseudopilin [Alteromonas sp. 5E99-2]MBO1255805.1 GspH/FimT family pseudopilin [Alteromonas sp. 5E99-2]